MPESLNQKPDQQTRHAGDVARAEELGGVLVTESKRPAHDPFLEALPLLLSDGVPEQRPPTFDELDSTTKTRYLELMRQREHLAEQGMLPTGKDVVIFVSDVGTSDEISTVVDAEGNESFFVEYVRSKVERREHEGAAQSIAHQIKNVTVGEVQASIRPATRESIDEAVFDRNVAHIIFIGHSNSSNLAIGPTEDYTWADPPQPLDHLKLSFGVFGCGKHKAEAQPGIGLALTSSQGILYGIGQDYFDEGTPYDFDQLVQLPNTPLEGTPSIN